MTTTQEADDFFTASSNKAEAPKDGNGRYRLPDPSTGKDGSYTRATTVSGTLEDKFHISQWRQRMVAHGLALRPDLYALAAATPLEDKQALNKLADDACDAAGTSTGANFGTALHGFTAVLDSGGDVSKIPEQFRADITAYHQVLAAAGIKAVPGYIERTCLNTDFGIAGTFDRIYQLPDGSLVIGDLKTQKTMDFGAGSQGIQLALYSRAKVLRDFEKHTYEPMPPVRQDLGLIVHLPVGKATATLHWVNLNLGYHGAALAMQVREYRNLKNIVTPYTPGTPLPPVGGVPSMLETQLASTITVGVPPEGFNDNSVTMRVDAGFVDPGKAGAESAAQQILEDPANSTPQAVAAAEQVLLRANPPSDDALIETLAKQSKQLLQASIRKLDPAQNVSKYRKDLAQILVGLRRERGLDPETGSPMTSEQLSADTARLAQQVGAMNDAASTPNGYVVTAQTDVTEEVLPGPAVDSAPATVAAAQAPWPPDPVPVNGRAAVLEGLPTKVVDAQPAEANPFAPNVNPFDSPEPAAPIDPAVELAGRMSAAASKQELAEIWNDAIAAGCNTPELQGIGGKRMMELKAAGQA